jgi:arylsulfatase
VATYIDFLSVLYKYADLLVAMNDKLNALIESEVGEDAGQGLPGGNDAV